MNTSETPFRGLSPFLRMNIAGADLQPVAQELLALAAQNQDDANLWMNLSLVMQCMGQRDLGLTMQQEALKLSRIYAIPARKQPAALRLLMLMVPGDLSANTPLECLLEEGDIDLNCFYIMPGEPLALPEHDAVFVAIGDSDENTGLLAALAQLLENWGKPVLNPPLNIRATDRAIASELLTGIPGLQIPPTLHASRQVLQEIATGVAGLPGGCDFPIILRPVGSQAGRDLDRIADPAQMAAYLDKVADEEYFLSRFIDYSGADGQFRKFRIALVDGVAYACHMAVSSHWMVHYVNAGMYEDAGKRAQELAFMENFPDFAQRHRAALDAIHQRSGLDYLCIDCAETAAGELLIFEIDHVMVVHAMDPAEMFPYKAQHIHKVQQALRDLLLRRVTRHSEAQAA